MSEDVYDLHDKSRREEMVDPGRGEQCHFCLEIIDDENRCYCTASGPLADEWEGEDDV